jgi:disease resistance protein RPS2
VVTQATRISELLRTKSFLLLVDDLRVQLDLQAVGIPYPLRDVKVVEAVQDSEIVHDAKVVAAVQDSEVVEAVQDGEVSRRLKRKIVVTSISQSICHLMDVEMCIQVPDLGEDEARQLFAQEFGVQDLYSDPSIGALTEALVRELKSMPSDLIRYGKVMQGIRDVRQWEDTLDAVTKANLQRDDPLNLVSISINTQLS